MSTKILVIPEDPKNNGYILKPIVERLLLEAGRPAAQITILPRPSITGIVGIKEAIRNELPKTWKWMDLWIFIPDADRTNADALLDLEAKMEQQGVPLISCAANPELESWMLAGHYRKLPIDWKNVAGHPRFKEEVFDPFMKQHGLPMLPGKGREKLTLETLKNYPELKNRCPEIVVLEMRIRKFFSKI